MLLATGVTNRRPPMDEELHDDALARGLIRYCPICDGYEVTDKKVGVIGSDSHGVAEALFLRGFTADVTLIAPDKAMRLKPEDQAEAEEPPGSNASTGRPQAVAIYRRLHRRRHRRGALHLRQHLSGAGLRHAHAARRNGRRRAQRTTAASRSTAISAPACRASTPRATSSSVSTRSAMPWAKAASPRRPSATILRRRAALARAGRHGGAEAELGEEFGVEDDAAVFEVGDPGA